MFEHYGYYVRKLHRSEYAGLNLKGLKPGEWRYLTAVELNSLTKK
jgi:16S rRNA U516 pseudouridylate synthase RsuA-like enzyme